MHIEIKMPDIGLDKVEVTEILVKIGQRVQLEQGLIIVEGDKTSMEIPSPISGIIKKINIKIGDKISTSHLIMICAKNDIKKEQKNVFSMSKQILHTNSTNNKNIVHATPTVRRLARNLNINLNEILGSGRKNRILKEDLESYQKNISQEKNQINENNCLSNNINELKANKVMMTNAQRIIGNNLHQNWINIPHVTQFDEVNITLLENFRKKYNDEHRKKNNTYTNITILTFIIKAVSHALLHFPIFNSSLSFDKKTIIFKKYINIGIAIDVKNNLFVPVLTDINKKNITCIASELIAIIKKTNKDQLKKSDMKNGSFTISNLGGIGGSWFSPIINAPEVAILGVSKAIIKPFWDNEKFVPSLMLPLSLSYDHRVINGAEAARFITFIGKLLSDIRFLIM